MSETMIEGIPVTLRQSARARRITLRVSRLDGRVTLTVPRGVATREALEFARTRTDWMRQQLARRPEVVTVTFGAEVLLEGQPFRIAQGAGRRVLRDGGEILVPGHADQVGARLRAYLKEAARSRLAAACDSYAQRLGRPFGRLTLRDTRSRWGSCSSRGDLMFSWRLIMAPPEVLDYVAAHEVAHLEEMNHSSAFWAVVDDLYGPHKSQRSWLRNNGDSLHRYRFDD